MANEKSNILYLFDRPAEPVYVPKGEKKVAFDIPAGYLVSPNSLDVLMAYRAYQLHLWMVSARRSAIVHIATLSRCKFVFTSAHNIIVFAEYPEIDSRKIVAIEIYKLNQVVVM